jgi:hypothetical protein
MKRMSSCDERAGERSARLLRLAPRHETMTLGSRRRGVRVPRWIGRVPVVASGCTPGHALRAFGPLGRYSAML